MVKNFLGYFSCLVIALMFLIVLNSRVGFAISIALFSSGIISLMLMHFARKKISIDVKAKTTAVAKGDTIELSFDISKGTVLPTPFIEVCFNSSKNVRAMSPERFRIAMGFSKETKTYKITYKAEHFGMAKIEISSVRLIDYLGLGNVAVKFESHESRFGVLPVIQSISGQNELLRICCDANAYDDNAEETDEATTIGMGVAGYEHREYTPGDPIKRINWKLSSKRDNLMIRLDEKLASTSQAVILDISLENSDSEHYYKTADITAESALAMAGLMLRQGLSCDVYYFSQGAWQACKIEAESDLLELQLALSAYEPYAKDYAMPSELVKQRGTRLAMLFSNADKSLSTHKSSLEAVGCEIYAAVPYTVADGAAASYSVSEDFDFTSV